MVKKGYKQTGVGVIPEDWEVVSLNSLSIGGMQNGVFYEVDRKGTGVSFLNVGDLYRETPIRCSSLQKFNATQSEIDRFRINSGDLFFTRSSIVPSGIAYCNWYYGLDDEVTVFDSHVVRFKTDLNKVVPMYLYLQCISPSSRKYFIANSKTATMTTIDQTILGDCQIALPLLQEQEKIAQTISDIDNLISNYEKLIAKKKAIKQGAMQDLLTGKIRLNEYSDKLTVSRIRDLFYYINGKAMETCFNNNYGYKVISIGNFSTNSKYIDTGIYVDYSYAGDLKKLIAKKNDLVMILNDKTAIGTILGRVLWIDCDNKYIVNQRSVILRLINSSFSANYFYYLLNSSVVREVIMKKSKPGTQIYLNLPDVLELNIQYTTNIEEQAAIASILSDMDNEIEELEQKLNKTRKLKQGMMQQLLTGKIRLY